MSYREFLEIHDILGESSSLIRENIMDSAKLFIQIWRLCLCLDVLGNIIDKIVPLNEVSLNKFHDF